MKNFLVIICLSLGTLVLSACSVFGKSSVEIAPYTVIEKSEAFELRTYDRLVLVSTPMESADGRNGAFGRLFQYISGTNEADKEIPMTAPVFMDPRGGKADNTIDTMSFVMPRDFSMADTPKPQDPSVTLEELTDYTVAVITFNGTLDDDNIKTHKEMLEQWVEAQGYVVMGGAKMAGYNAPFTLPAMRRNEVLIPVQKP